MMKDYGTLEALPVEQKKSRKTAIVAAVVLVFGVVALMGATSYAKANSVVDSNLGRGAVAPIDAGVKKIFQNVCRSKTGPNKKRFAIAAFNEVTLQNKQSYKLLPQVEVGASDHFQGDWRSFKNMLPRRHPAVAFAVYNFPVWADPVAKKEKELIIPAFVTFRKRFGKGSDVAAKYLGGTFLGGAYLAASANKCTAVAIQVNERTTYEQACVQVLRATNKIPKQHRSEAKIKQMCAGVEKTECPFAAGKDSPCCANRKGCKKPCAGVSSWSRNHYSKACCANVVKYCSKPGRKGCNPYERAIYAQNCNPAFGGTFQPKIKILAGLADEDDVCLPACQSSCNSLASRLEVSGAKGVNGKAQTYKKCSGCATDNVARKYGKTTFRAMCHRKAPGFQNMRCCGMRKDCGQKVAQEKDKCNLYPSPMKKGQECKWLAHQDCGKYIIKQKEATSPKGCCGSKNGELQVRCCDGGKGKTVSCKGKPKARFLVNKKCPVNCAGAYGKCAKGIKVYAIKTKAANGGKACAIKAGTKSKAGCKQPAPAKKPAAKKK